MTTSAANERRGTLFILKGFQTRFIVRYILLVAGGILLFSILLYFLLNRTLGENLYQAHLNIQSTGRLLLPYLVATSLLAVLLVGVGVVIVTLVISHKIAGPLYRIQSCIEEMGNGDMTARAKLRDKDQLTGLAETFNQSVAKVGGSMTAINEDNSKIEELLGIVQERLETGDREDIKGLLFQAGKAQQRIKDRLSLFRF